VSVKLEVVDQGAEAGVAALRTRNRDPNSGCVQFRISDAFNGDHLDKNEYWLRKDGLDQFEITKHEDGRRRLRSEGRLQWFAVPPPLIGHISLSRWTKLHEDIARATEKYRCDYMFWLFLGGCHPLLALCSPISCFYCIRRTNSMKKLLGDIVEKFNHDLPELDLHMSSYESFWGLDKPPLRFHHLLKHERENDRGVVVFQINVKARLEDDTDGTDLALLRARNSDPNSGCAQFRVSDSLWGDHLDDNNYWLKKDKLDRCIVPPPLAGHLTPEQWTSLHDDIAHATSRMRCDGRFWCLLGGICCNPLGQRLRRSRVVVKCGIIKLKK